MYGADNPNSGCNVLNYHPNPYIFTVRSLTLVCRSASITRPAQSCHSYWKANSQCFLSYLVVSKIFPDIPGNSRPFQAFLSIPSYYNLFHSNSTYFSLFGPILFYYHRMRLSISEAVYLESCFLLEPKAFCKLTVYIVSALGAHWYIRTSWVKDLIFIYWSVQSGYHAK